MSPKSDFENINISIIGLGTEYPLYGFDAEGLNWLSKRWYPDNSAMQKVLSILQLTGIETRSSIGPITHELINRKESPSIAELHEAFTQRGVPLAVSAAKKAIAEANIDLSEITHVISTTCTDSGNPGFDYAVCNQLGIKHPVERVLVQGVACSGGLASLRTAAGLALGYTARGKPARILCIALEVTTSMVRSEMDSITESQETRLGIALFSDSGSAVVLSNGIGRPTKPIYELVGWTQHMLFGCDDDLELAVHPRGWKMKLSPRVPKLTSDALPAAFENLKSVLPPLPANYRVAADFDWAMHPGGLTILTSAEKKMNITPEHMRASYDTYIKHGNSSSATIFNVLNRLRTQEMDALAPAGGARDYVITCAFGPGVSVEMNMLKRVWSDDGDDSGIEDVD